MTQNKYITILIRISFYAVAIAIAFIAIKYLLPWLAPFLLAFLTAAVIEPAVRGLVNKFGIKRSFASAACSLAILSVICGMAAFLTGQAISELNRFVNDFPSMLSGLPDTFASINDKIDWFIVSAPPDVQDYLEGVLDSLAVNITGLPATLSGKLLEWVSSIVSSAPRILLFLITYAIGVFFISGSYVEIRAFLIRQIPARYRTKASNMKAGITDTLAKWLKAQVMLMCVTFLELTVAFIMIRIEYAAFLALFVAIVDALPVFGVGTILLPWAVIELLFGSSGRAAALFVIYCAVTIVRNSLEPRLVGGMLGVHQVPMLAATYIGFCAAGVAGMILFPIILIFIKQLADNGYIKLYK